MKCFGIDVSTGDHVEVRYDSVIQIVDHPVGVPDPDVFIAPAWIDLQVNGYAGVDYNSPSTSIEEIARSLRVLYSTGTARVLPTVITGSPEDMTGSLRNLAKARTTLPAIEGFHVEGPSISPDEGPRGAHPARWVRKPDLQEYRRWQDAADGAVRLVTLSPEWPEAPAYIEALVEDGCVASIGHMNASSQQIQDAVRAGATMSTHLGNGSHAVLPRHPNYLWDQLAEDRLAAGFIVDRIHLSASFFKTALRAKGVMRSLLVTDASMPACAAPGIYQIGEQEIELTADDRVVLRGTQRLAGSALRMDRAIENVIAQTGISLAEAVSMANRNPARFGRISGRQRGLTPGERADFVLFRYDRDANRIEIVQTVCGGETVWYS